MGLLVEEVATDAAAAAIRLTAQLPRGFGDLASQIKRAATSVLLNIAEGTGRRGGDGRYHFAVAYGSAREVKAALTLVGRLQLLDRQVVADCWLRMDRVASMLWPLARIRR
jgi:four helix bundle protein